MVGRRPVRAGLRADHAAALRRRHGGAAGHGARAGRRRTRRCRARSVRDRLGSAGGRAQQDQAASRRRRSAPRPAGGPVGSRVVDRRRTDRHRRRRRPVGFRLPRRRSVAVARRRACRHPDPVAAVRTGHRRRHHHGRAAVAGCRRRTCGERRRGPAGVADRADRRNLARRVVVDRRRAAPRTSGRWHAVVTDGGDRAVGAPAGRDAGACACLRRGTGGVAGAERSAGRSARGARAADGARRNGATAWTATGRCRW